MDSSKAGYLIEGSGMYWPAFDEKSEL